MVNTTIKDFLIKNGIKQKHFAKEIGVTNVTISNYISGKSKPTYSTKQRIIKYMQKIEERSNL